MVLYLCTKFHVLFPSGSFLKRHHAFLIPALDGGEWSASRPDRFTPRKTAPRTRRIGGPEPFLNAVVKRKIPSPRRESHPRTPIVQPVAQRYTDWAIASRFAMLFTPPYKTSGFIYWLPLVRVVLS
jgi:hypothetical protein